MKWEEKEYLNQGHSFPYVSTVTRRSSKEVAGPPRIHVVSKGDRSCNALHVLILETSWTTGTILTVHQQWSPLLKCDISSQLVIGCGCGGFLALLCFLRLYCDAMLT